MLFETKRLQLRRFTIDDAPAVLEFSSNEEVIKFTGDKVISSIDEAKDLINGIWLAEYEKYGYARMAVVHKKDKKVIGFSGLKFDTEFNATDIGYRLLPKYWGKGLATESALPFIFYGFTVLKMPKIIGVSFSENKASCKVLENLGLNLVKQGDRFKDGIDCKWYQLDREDYQFIAQSKKSKKKR